MRRRRAVLVGVLMTSALVALGVYVSSFVSFAPKQGNTFDGSASFSTLETLTVKGRAPKTGYARSQFGNGWLVVSGCSTRHLVLYRDLREVIINESCVVQQGVLNDPYTGKEIRYNSSESSTVQIDHIVALSDAWQKGAQGLSPDEREQLANDPLNLLAVDGPINQQKGDADAATWLPPNKGFRCEYVARQVDVKAKYHLWVTNAEKEAMKKVLVGC